MKLGFQYKQNCLYSLDTLSHSPLLKKKVLHQCKELFINQGPRSQPKTDLAIKTYYG